MYGAAGVHRGVAAVAYAEEAVWWGIHCLWVDGLADDGMRCCVAAEGSRGPRPVVGPAW